MKLFNLKVIFFLVIFLTLLSLCAITEARKKGAVNRGNSRPRTNRQKRGGKRGRGKRQRVIPPPPVEEPELPDEQYSDY
uniref:Uncharacterized protein n=1 Tax=Parastrongyloides trichosuri TaxID=131310 RepID=A0A0N4Z685_PARTI